MSEKNYRQVTEQRIEQLRAELEKGHAIVVQREEMFARLTQLDAEAPQLSVRMTRISAAIQVLEEILGLREVE